MGEQKRGTRPDQKGVIWYYKLWDQDQQFFKGLGVRLRHIKGIRGKTCHAFGIRDQNFGYKNGINDDLSRGMKLLKELADRGKSKQRPREKRRGYQSHYLSID